MFRDVAVIGCGMTRFGRRDDKTLMNLMIDSSLKAIRDAGIEESDIDALFVANMLAEKLNHQTLIATALADQLGLRSASADRIENGTASGGSAFRNACLAIASGAHDLVLVTGGEKMTHASSERVTDIIATMNHPAEYIQGATLPALAAMFARLYMRKYGVEQKHMAMVAVKNHLNALKNPYAHLHRRVTLDEILYAKDSEVKNPIVAEPLRLYDCCPVSDGAASVVLCSAEKARKFNDTPIVIAGFGQANDNLGVYEREDATILWSLREASRQAFNMAKLEPDDIDVAELHDAFTILEIAESEDAGFFKKGTGHRALEEGLTSLSGKLPINVSGGLKARGHPIGATGVAQIVELTWQLRGEAGARQVVGAEKAFSCNSGGFASNMVAFVMERSS